MLRARAREIRARRKSADAGGGGPEAERVAGDESRARSPRFHPGRHVRRSGGFRSGNGWRSRDVREAASIFGWDEACLRERRAGPERWRAHGREAWQGALGAGEDEISSKFQAPEKLQTSSTKTEGACR